MYLYHTMLLYGCKTLDITFVMILLTYLRAKDLKIKKTNTILVHVETIDIDWWVLSSWTPCLSYLTKANITIYNNSDSLTVMHFLKKSPKNRVLRIFTGQSLYGLTQTLKLEIFTCIYWGVRAKKVLKCI